MRSSFRIPTGRADVMSENRWRRVATVIGGGILVTLALAGCVTSGIVTGKVYDDPYTACSAPRPGQPAGYCNDYDECWSLALRNDQGKEGAVCVSQDSWESTDVGDFYDGPTVQR